jgi:putative transposase
MSSYRLIEAQKTSFPVQFIYRMLGVSRSGYYDWKARAPSRSSREDAALTKKIGEIKLTIRPVDGVVRQSWLPDL